MGNIRNSNGVITANNLTLNAIGGSIFNAGELYAESDLLLSAENSIINDAGLFSAGGAMKLRAEKGNVVSSGGFIESLGRSSNDDVAGLDIIAGGSISLSETSVSAKTAQFLANNGSFLNRGGSLNIKESLLVSAGEDIDVSSAVLNASRISLQAEDNIYARQANIQGAQGESVLLNAANGNINMVGSQISGGDIVLQAGSDINAQRSILIGDDQKGVMLIAHSGSIDAALATIKGGDLTLRAKESIYAQKSKLKSEGGVSITSVAGSLDMSASFVQSQQGLHVVAKGDILAQDAFFASSQGELSFAAREGSLLLSGTALQSDSDLNLYAQNNILAANVKIDVASSDALLINSSKGSIDMANANLTGGELRISAHGDVTLNKARLSGANSGDAAGGDASSLGIYVSSKEGNIDLSKADLQASQEIIIQALQGNVHGNGSSIVSFDARVALLASGQNADEGNIYSVDSFISGRDLLLEASGGSIYSSNSELRAGDADGLGQVRLIARDGNIDITETGLSGKTIDVILGGNLDARNAQFKFSNTAGLNLTSHNGSINLANASITGGLVNIGAKHRFLGEDLNIDSRAGSDVVYAMYESWGVDVSNLSHGEGLSGITIKTETGRISLQNASITSATGSRVQSEKGDINLNNLQLSSANDAVFQTQAGGITAENGQIRAQNLFLQAYEDIIGRQSSLQSFGGNISVRSEDGFVELTSSIVEGMNLDVVAKEKILAQGLTLKLNREGSANFVAQEGELDHKQFSLKRRALGIFC